MNAISILENNVGTPVLVFYEPALLLFIVLVFKTSSLATLYVSFQVKDPWFDPRENSLDKQASSSQQSVFS